MNDIVPKPSSKASKKKVNATNREISTAKQTMVEAKVREMLQEWERGGHSHINRTKVNRIVQVYLKNFKSLSIKK